MRMQKITNEGGNMYKKTADSTKNTKILYF